MLNRLIDGFGKPVVVGERAEDLDLPAPMATRIEVWLHVAMCRHCRAFRRQMALIDRAAHLAAAVFEREPSASFESKILHHLGS